MLDSFDDLDDEGNDIDDDTDASGNERGGRGVLRRRSRKGRFAQWTRWLHVYTSMISLLIVLFFGVTGLTLNHPSWSLGTSATTKSYSGTLPDGFDANGNVDFLTVAEYVRKTNGVRGSVADHRANDTDGSISFKGPGYAADLFFDVNSGSYQLTVVEQGILGVLNDLHKGRDTSSKWNWTIDASAIFLVAVAVTGLGIQIFQKKRRRRALSFAAVFGVLALILIAVTSR